MTYLMFGSINGASHQIVLATVNIATLSVSYQRSLPKFLSTFNEVLSNLASATKFYLGGYDKSINLNSVPLTETLSSFSQGVFLSSDPTETCQVL